MAKSIRSKSMRKNRAHLRATVIEPVVLKRQQQIAKALVKSIEEKKKNSSLAGLVNLTKVGGNKAPSKVAQEEKGAEEEESEQDEEDYESMEEEKEEVKARSVIIEDKSASRHAGKSKGKAFKASRVSSSKPAKEMVWFK